MGAPLHYDAGTQIGDLTIIGPLDERRAGLRVWECRCVCGKTTKVRSANLKGGRHLSCGCRRARTLRVAMRRHGHTRSHASPSPTYATWLSMKDRCRNAKHKSFKDYGGRGVTICERWDLFENFLADMGERPKGRTIDRIDPSGNYEPGNCRWATALEQRHNRRTVAA